MSKIFFPLFQVFDGAKVVFGRFEGQGAQSAMGEVTSGMGAMGVALGVGAAAMGAIAVAGFAAAKSLGEYGMEIKNVELRTGMSSKEVGQFGFAARMAGQVKAKTAPPARQIIPPNLTVIGAPTW
jgi:hypothetical protein